ncbi:hypothetical protein SAM23877_0384 [Streptomyces ambofaciens ATCC 23877]|uniref:Uncharacterized protein n=1 Tax=Streptomyces ambofaciens (strain ATCC 23877 / 3486 / DSM 40053 / JCM 4204 / NBRC 12836 / NRRL B-2516) TaxID=278992 RepID=A0A0K2AK99_STRA7|nr:hypothetical protein SAM23877_0384 [Streptomyces ambofaciens ATCC 23877]
MRTVSGVPPDAGTRRVGFRHPTCRERDAAGDSDEGGGADREQNVRPGVTAVLPRPVSCLGAWGGLSAFRWALSRVHAKPLPETALRYRPGERPYLDEPSCRETVQGDVPVR